MTDRPTPPRSRAEILAAMAPQLIADVRMFTQDEGGRRSLAFPGWGCPCMVSQMEPLVGYDGFPQLGDTPLNPGDRRRMGFVFMTEEGGAVMRRAGTFHLWEGGFIGIAHVVGD
jgi:hypothetical protein